MILVDIDGVITNNEGVGNFDDWESKLADFPPNPGIINLLRPHISEIAFVTARGERFRAPTMAWFEEHWAEAASYCSFYFRARGDERPSDEIKREVAAGLLERGFPISLGIDDLKSVVDAYRSLGITAMQHLTPNAHDYTKDPHDGDS